MTLLKLRAEDAEDVQVVSAVLQDSIAPICDIIYRAEEKNFIMIVHRLRREEEAAGLERICCAVNVRGVEHIQTHGIQMEQQGRMLNLLAMSLKEECLTFIFAADAKLRLQLIDGGITIEDFGEAWPAQCLPCHEVEAAR